MRAALERLAGFALDWTVLDDYLLQYCTLPETRKTVRASTFAASLELVREGRISLRQANVFAPIYIKARNASDTQTAA